ncbi:proteasome accessory factor PafA2 [Corynebacterium sp. 13CS0277]|uniref:depupylase/deamidase Dop n=1 Tax=Corynebacterium sp. 13CS0277 TaxID=2071994 RepID=UPI000D02FC1A|nr:depupylase/deamidase Dop [Corynebacterium sp. 13CS0277]PRQ12059.1 proteasome accessory factor PafA2 [Corynebacterium sp. 13CS0277]
MSRILGTETEYGIATPGDAFISPIVTSTHVVVGFATDQQQARGTRWDFEGESPLRDARGFDLRRYHTTPVVAADGMGVANMVLGNGARFYVDHAHPEYSAPETTTARQAMVYDQAGDRIMHWAAQLTAERSSRGESALEGHPPCPAVKMYKNNVDGKGASFGAHENYQYSRALDFDVLAQALIPFFVTRQILCGAGRVGLGPRSEEQGFQISQRADYIEQEISLETTLNRGIINTRDEPHADREAFGRLHVIIGDANLSQIATLLKVGCTSLVIDAVERGVDFQDLRLLGAVRAVQTVSRDLELREVLPLADGRAMTAIDIQREYLRRVADSLPAAARTPDVEEVLALWEEVLTKLAADPLSTADMLDWTAKLALIERYRARGATWDDPKLALVDLQYHDIDPAKGLALALMRTGRMRTLVDEDTIQQAMTTPPRDTRAWLRGLLMQRCAADVVAANWDSVVVSLDGALWRLGLGDGRELQPGLADALENAAAGDIPAVLAAWRAHAPQWLSPLG